MPATVIRWFMAVLLAVSSVPFVFSSGAAYADTSEDTVAPQITSVEIVGGDRSYAPGDTVTVRIGFVEEGTGVSSANVSLIQEDVFVLGRLRAADTPTDPLTARLRRDTREPWMSKSRCPATHVPGIGASRRLGLSINAATRQTTLWCYTTTAGSSLPAT